MLWYFQSDDRDPPSSANALAAELSQVALSDSAAGTPTPGFFFFFFFLCLIVWIGVRLILVVYSSIEPVQLRSLLGLSNSHESSSEARAQETSYPILDGTKFATATPIDSSIASTDAAAATAAVRVLIFIVLYSFS